MFWCSVSLRGNSWFFFSPTLNFLCSCIYWNFSTCSNYTATHQSFECLDSEVLLRVYDKGIFVSHFLLITENKTTGIPKIGQILFLLITRCVGTLYIHCLDYIWIWVFKTVLWSLTDKEGKRSGEGLMWKSIKQKRRTITIIFQVKLERI